MTTVGAKNIDVQALAEFLVKTTRDGDQCKRIQAAHDGRCPKQYRATPRHDCDGCLAERLASDITKFLGTDSPAGTKKTYHPHVSYTIRDRVGGRRRASSGGFDLTVRGTNQEMMVLAVVRKLEREHKGVVTELKIIKV